MSLDALKNFAISTLASGITNSATSLSVATGEGGRFPAVPFNATIWNSTDYADAATAYHAGAAEIVRVTAISTDTFTITRAQESTAAVAHNTAGKTYAIHAGLTARIKDLIPPDAQPLGVYDTAIATRMRQDFNNTVGYSSNGSTIARNVYDATYGFGGITLTPTTNEAKLRPFSSFGETDFDISIFTGSSRLCFAARIYTPVALSDGTDGYEFAFGFFPGGGWPASKWLILYYNHGTNSGKWLARAKNSSETTADTGVTYTANTWFDLRIEANYTNAKFYINGALVATISSNLPVGTCGSQMLHWRTGGATRTTYAKFMELYYTP